MTFTFLGFNVSDTLQCTDPKNDKDVIKGCTIPESVHKFLLRQNVDLKQENCNSWSKYVCYKILAVYSKVNVCYHYKSSFDY